MVSLPNHRRSFNGRLHQPATGIELKAHIEDLRLLHPQTVCDHLEIAATSSAHSPKPCLALQQVFRPAESFFGQETCSNSCL